MILAALELLHRLTLDRAIDHRIDDGRQCVCAVLAAVRNKAEDLEEGVRGGVHLLRSASIASAMKYAHSAVVSGSGGFPFAATK